ncbi:MAG TPA: SDR family NAD(P)-dependent oxidoreductase [Gammaproteobacteria bacterium]|nr:SDR family NAD(P)-dependent oxidoreductase [Gammaproteobacteria bacterium]
MQLQDISGKTALVTGASSGIGMAAARALHGEGMRVALAARSADKLQALAEELGEDCMVVPTDVGDEQQVEHLFARVKEQWGGLDLLLNNAGVGYAGSLETGNTEEWRATIDANLYGVLFCTRAAIPLLRGRPGAMISTVSSVGGRHGIEGWAVYNATKFAVVGLHDALRKELGPEGIRVSLIEPGAVYTQWGYNVSEQAMRERRDSVEALHAEDVATALVHAFVQPANVNLQEMLIMPTRQTYP